MKWLLNFKIGERLALGFITMIVFMVIIGILGYRGIWNIQSDLDEIFNVRMPAMDFLIEADRDLQQLLVAERSMIISDTKTSVFRGFIDDYEENLKQSEERWNKYKKLVSDEEETALFEEYETAREKWKKISREIVDGLTAGTEEGRRAAKELSLGDSKLKFEQMRDFIDRLTEINLKIAEARKLKASASYRRTIFWFLVITGIGIVIGLFLAVIIARTIIVPLQNAVDVADGLAQGDLSRKFGVAGKDETGRMLIAMKKMRDRINDVLSETEILIQAIRNGKLDVKGDEASFSGSWRELISGINELVEAFNGPIRMTMENIDRISKGDIPERITEEYKGDFNKIRNNLNTMTKNLVQFAVDVQASAEQVAAGSEQLAGSASQISQGTTQQSAGVEEISSSMEQMGAMINQSAENAKQTALIAEKASQDAGKGNKAVKDTVQAMQTITEKILIIEKIAGQTSMLALNAAIESARAGRYGKGFAVVASEIRELAKNTEIAAKDINALSISNLNIAEKTGQLLEEMVSGIQKTSELVQEISASSVEQAGGIGEVNAAMLQLEEVIQENAASTEEMAGSSQEFSSQAERLLEVASFFKISDALKYEMGEDTEDLNEMEDHFIDFLDKISDSDSRRLMKIHKRMIDRKMRPESGRTAPAEIREYMGDDKIGPEEKPTSKKNRIKENGTLIDLHDPDENDF